MNGPDYPFFPWLFAMIGALVFLDARGGPTSA